MDPEYLIKEFIEKGCGRTNLSEHEVKALLRKMGIPVPEGKFFSAGISIPVKPDLAYPLVAKLSSEKIQSKTELHGVRTGLHNESDLQSAISDILRIEGAEGVLVEEMAPSGIEVIVGGLYDDQFGPVMMFGIGGIYAELFRDVSFGLAPLSEEDAYWMIAEIKGGRLLEGYRGKAPVDEKALVQILTGISEIMSTGLIEEIDLNPVALYPYGAMVLDAKMKLRTAAENPVT